MNTPALLLSCLGMLLGTELLDVEKARGAVTHRATTCGQVATTSITLTTPAGTQAGDVLIASVGYAHSNASVATPSGWTQVPNLRGAFGADQELITWYRVVSGSPPANYSFPGDAGTDAISASLSAFRGVDTSAPIAGTPAQTIISSLTTSGTLPNSTGSAAGSMRFSSVAIDDGSTTTFSSGLTTACIEDNESGTDVSLGTAYESTGSGTTTTRTFTLDDNGHLAMQTFVLAPAPCGGGSLGLTEPGSVSFASTALDGTDKTVTSTANFTVDDATGLGSGWNLSATSTTFTSGGNTLPTTATTITGVTPTAGSGRCSAPTNAIGYPVVLPAAASAPAASKIYNAAVNTGKGPTNLAFGLSLGIPARTRVGSYTSTWTFTLATGP